jgi:membrane-bound acyltransferase YfiQ involved in biofilm formation
MDKKFFVWVSAFSFIIYSVHAPLVAYLINPTLALLDPLPGTQLLAFALLPLAIIILAVAIGSLLRMISPKIYGLLTGGRGF